MRLQLPALLPLLFACNALGPDHRTIDALANAPVDLDHMADVLVGADVVFLGEFHDNDIGHELQLALTERLLARRPDLVVSLEMFERDAQTILDLYLEGAVDEETFLARARPWPNYAEHYRPVVELARRHGLRVLAANCYRPLASRVAKQGRWSIAGDPWAAQRVDAEAGPYKDKFVGLMGDHATDMGAALDNFFAAQCVKDDTMAESIARELTAHGQDRPLVVHWCGAFHSDEGLGTVERLEARLPGVRVGLVTMITSRSRTRPLTDAERGQADFVWLVPPR
jgi:uncharacterized iron-regulated protein